MLFEGNGKLGVFTTDMYAILCASVLDVSVPAAPFPALMEIGGICSRLEDPLREVDPALLLLRS